MHGETLLLRKTLLGDRFSFEGPILHLLFIASGHILARLLAREIEKEKKLSFYIYPAAYYHRYCISAKIYGLLDTRVSLSQKIHVIIM